METFPVAFRKRRSHTAANAAINCEALEDRQLLSSDLGFAGRRMALQSDPQALQTATSSAGTTTSDRVESQEFTLSVENDGAMNHAAVQHPVETNISVLLIDDDVELCELMHEFCAGAASGSKRSMTAAEVWPRCSSGSTT